MWAQLWCIHLKLVQGKFPCIILVHCPLHLIASLSISSLSLLNATSLIFILSFTLLISMIWHCCELLPFPSIFHLTSVFLFHFTVTLFCIALIYCTTIYHPSIHPSVDLPLLWGDAVLFTTPPPSLLLQSLVHPSSSLIVHHWYSHSSIFFHPSLVTDMCALPA